MSSARKKAMIRISDVVAHLGDGITAEAFGEGIGNSFREFTVPFLKYRKCLLPLAEFLKVSHRVTQNVKAPLEIQALHHFPYECCVVGVVEGFEHIEELLVTCCQRIRVERVDRDVG
jgi:hypothetical protein